MTLVPERTEPIGATTSDRARRFGDPIWWLPLLLMVATEYKFRRRLNEDSLSGSLDVFVLIELFVYGLVAAYLAFRRTPRMRWHPIPVMLVAYCLATAVSAIYAPFPTLAAARAVQLLILMFVMVHWISAMNLAMVRTFVHGYVVLVTVSILIGMVYVAPTTIRQVGRFTWLYTHSVIAGAMMASSAVILFGMWLTHASARLPWARWVYGAMLVLNLVSVLRSRTRGSIGAVAIAIAVMALIWLHGRARRDLAVVFGIVVTAILVTSGHVVLEFLTRGESTQKIASFNRRTEIWSLAWEEFLRHPLHGLGFTAARGVFYDETGLGGAHNAYINVAIDVGLVGLLFWVGLIWATFSTLRRVRAIRRARNQPTTFDEVTVMGLMIAHLINGVTTEGLGGGVSALALMLFLTGAWALALSDRTGNDPARSPQ